MNYFKSAEQVLSSVPALKRSLQNLERRKERIIENGAPGELGAVDPSKPYVNSTFVSDTLNDLLELNEVTKCIKLTEAKLEEIEGVLSQLEEEQRKILVMWYIERRKKESIAEALAYESITTVYDKRNRAVAEFALSYYGAAALSSI